MVAHPRWLLRPLDPDLEAEAVPSLGRAVGLPPLLARLLWIRGVRTPEAAYRFLNPNVKHLSPPHGLPDIGPAAERLVQAVKAGESIVVCGDYDVDGMTGTALLLRFLRLVGATVDWSIPRRSQDGYGLSVETVRELAARGVRLLVTVDNGINALDAVAEARQLGLDVVITDHHLPGPVLPDALAVVNPHLGSQADPLCGCALAFKTAWAVADRLRGKARRDGVAFKQFLHDAMGLVALATLSDLVPLRDENRILVAAGLSALARSSHPGLRALLASANVPGVPSTEEVAFRLAPRLNAAGRLNRPDLVVSLLTAEDPSAARDLARQLEGLNRERRRVEGEVLKEAERQALEHLDRSTPKSLVVAGEGWHAGVLGIVAARLVDRYTRPTIVIGLDEGRGRGSGRTPRGLDLHAALSDCSEHLLRHGGHAEAAGLEIASERLDPFRRAFEAAVHRRHDGQLASQLVIDGRSRPEDWDLDAVRALRRFEPFGPENPEPLFLLEGVRPAGRPRILGSGGEHLAFTLAAGGGRTLRVLAWRRAAELHDLVTSGRSLDLVVTPALNTWRDQPLPELRLVDLEPSER